MSLLKTVFAALLFLPAIVLVAGKNNYPVSDIPQSLLPGANSVVRNSEILLEVENAGRANYHVHKVVTVLNQAGAQELDIFIYYDQFKHLGSFEATLFDKDGKQMNKRRLGDLQDYAMYDGFSLFNDVRLKKIQTGGGVFPVTIDYSYTLEMKGILDYPNWYPQLQSQAIENTSYEIKLPSEIEIKYQCSNVEPAPVPQIQKQNNFTTYTWKLNDIKAIKLPVNSYESGYFLPKLDISPLVFEISGYKGSWNSWKAFGSTMYEMWKKTEVLPEDVKKQAEEIIKGATTEREKAETLYSFLQREFRYVSIQIGIGGWVPFDVATVHHARYGDCKALSNYMCAVLNAVGVKAYPALVNAGADAHAIDTAFPSNYFNHAILYAELNDGPLWLECTSNSIPFGELGTFTENRYALVFDKEGGRIIKTPESDGALNTLTETSVIDITNDLQAGIKEKTELKGQFRQYARPALVLGTKEERSRYAFTYLKLLQPEVYALTNIADTLNQVSFFIGGHNEKIYDFKAGNKYFLPSTVIKSWYTNISADSTQKADFLLDFPSTKTEQLTFKLPVGSKASLPANYILENSLLHFARKCETKDDNSVSIKTELTLKKCSIKADELALLKESLQSLNKYLQQKLILEAF